MFLCQTALCCSLRLPAWCIFHDNVWEAQKNLRISSWTDPGGELHRNSRRTAASFQTGREDRNHSVKHPGTCESKFPNSTKLANKHYIFVPLIMSFQEGDIRSLHDSEDKRLVAESTLGRGRISQALLFISCAGTACLTPDRTGSMPCHMLFAYLNILFPSSSRLITLNIYQCR